MLRLKYIKSYLHEEVRWVTAIIVFCLLKATHTYCPESLLLNEENESEATEVPVVITVPSFTLNHCILGSSLPVALQWMSREFPSLKVYAGNGLSMKTGASTNLT